MGESRGAKAQRKAVGGRDTVDTVSTGKFIIGKNGKSGKGEAFGKKPDGKAKVRGDKSGKGGNAVDIKGKMALRRRGSIRDPTEGTDYRVYRGTPRDFLMCMGKAGILSLVLSWLFYHTLAGVVMVAFLAPMMYRMQKRSAIRARQENLRNQFKECIRVVTASMQAGYSAENAFGEAEKELTLLLGSDADMCRELRRVNQQLRLNVTIESLMQDLADRSGVEEISSFGEVFGYAKRNGSDFLRILTDTSERITEKAELEQEIQVMVSGRQMEQRVINVVPMGILCFIDLTSPEFLQAMYEGAFGRIAMTFCLLAYGGAYLLSKKLVDIRV